MIIVAAALHILLDVFPSLPRASIPQPNPSQGSRKTEGTMGGFSWVGTSGEPTKEGKSGKFVSFLVLFRTTWR